MNGRTSTVTAGRVPGQPGPMAGRPAPAGEHRPRTRAWPMFAGLGPVGALPTAPGVARAFTATVLGGWGMASAGDLVEISSVVVSELTTNVVRAATSGDGAPVYRDGRLTELWLRLLSDRMLLRVEVWDNLPLAAGVPVRRNPEKNQEHGRGLQLVDQLSQAWGWQPLPGVAAKSVWALLKSR